MMTRAIGWCGSSAGAFQRLKTWRGSKDPHYAAKKARIEQLYAIADREVTPQPGEPEVIFCADEFGPLNLQPRPGRQWAAISGKSAEAGRAPRPRIRATYTRTARVRHLLAAYELGPHLSTAKDNRVGAWAAANNTEVAYTPTNSSWLNRVEAQFTALRYFTLDGTDHASHKEQASMIRRYIIWRNNHAYDERLRRIVDRANVA